MTAAPAAQGPSCAFCGRPATEAAEPPRRTFERGVDPSDDSFSVTVILPDIPLCTDHVDVFDQGDRLVGWCDDEQCQVYGELDGPSACGAPYMKLTPGTRPRAARSNGLPSK
jgi:hypothetical protein